ncbi:hypothetical protein HDU76_010268 [Blyttiomyces sp. JEL0837]|nr:hypothetical protein HDU76_010268 [Blyttiomyces sp. JEL0837]
MEYHRAHETSLKSRQSSTVSVAESTGSSASRKSVRFHQLKVPGNIVPINRLSVESMDDRLSPSTNSISIPTQRSNIDVRPNMGNEINQSPSKQSLQPTPSSPLPPSLKKPIPQLVESIDDYINKAGFVASNTSIITSISSINSTTGFSKERRRSSTTSTPSTSNESPPLITQRRRSSASAASGTDKSSIISTKGKVSNMPASNSASRATALTDSGDIAPSTTTGPVQRQISAPSKSPSLSRDRRRYSLPTSIMTSSTTTDGEPTLNLGMSPRRVSLVGSTIDESSTDVEKVSHSPRRTSVGSRMSDATTEVIAVAGGATTVLSPLNESGSSTADHGFIKELEANQDAHYGRAGDGDVNGVGADQFLSQKSGKSQSASINNGKDKAVGVGKKIKMAFGKIFKRRTSNVTL